MSHPPRLRLHVEHLAPATGRKQDIRPGEVYTFTSLLAAENTPFKPRTLRLECDANAFEVESIRVGHEEQLLRRPVPLWVHANRLIELPVVRAGEVIALRVRNTSDATVTFIGRWSGDCVEHSRDELARRGVEPIAVSVSDDPAAEFVWLPGRGAEKENGMLEYPWLASIMPREAYSIAALVLLHQQLALASLGEFHAVLLLSAADVQSNRGRTPLMPMRWTSPLER